MANIRVLVIGATGVAGSAFINHVAGNPGLFTDWEIIGVTRNASHTLHANQHTYRNSGSTNTASHNIRYLSADLLGDHSTLKSLTDITHVVFAGFVPAPDFSQQVQPNRDILINCLNALDRCPIERVLLIQGMKYYGSHLGKFKTPAREDDPRHTGENYYYAQQDELERSGLNWICLRPHVICGTTSIGTPQNILSVIGVYASLMRDQNRPLHWPGTSASFAAINQATDATLLARAMAWFLIHADSRNTAFNITNGDYFRWENLWPRVAELFAMEAGVVETVDLAREMPPLSGRWQQLIQQHQLQPYAMDAIANWPFADYILRTGWDVMANTIKARQHGFHDCLDSEFMYLEHLRTLQQQRIIPDL